MADYKYIKDAITNDNSTKIIRRTSDGATIPINEDNRDGKIYLDWLAVPNTPDAA